MYEYQAEVQRIVDGDTLHVRVDLGFDIRVDQILRLLGIDAPELRTASGREARDFLTSLLPIGTVVTVRTVKDRREKYGRYLATVLQGDVSINDTLIASGHARPYDGGVRTP